MTKDCVIYHQKFVTLCIFAGCLREIVHDFMIDDVDLSLNLPNQATQQTTKIIFHIFSITSPSIISLATTTKNHNYLSHTPLSLPQVMAPSQIDILLRLLPDNPSRITTALESSPDLAPTPDAHGYTLLHASASYGHLDLLRLLVNQYKVDVNTRDEDGETALFYAERVDVVRCLVEELGADVAVRNYEGRGVEERWEEDGEGEWVGQAVEYVRSRVGGSGSGSAFTGDVAASNGTLDGVGSGAVIGQTARVPDNVAIQFGTMEELPSEELAADPEIRRKIEELAERGDLQSEDTQAELRALVTEVVTGMREDVVDGRDTQRRRVAGWNEDSTWDNEHKAETTMSRGHAIEIAPSWACI